MIKYFNQKIKGIKGVLSDINGFNRTSDDGQLQSVIGLDNLLIYGNSIQNGTPTIDNPVEIQNVGDKASNLFNISTVSGSEITINSDGSITVTGYPSNTGKTLAQLCPDLKSGDKFKVYFDTNGNRNIYLYGTQTTISQNTEYTATDAMLASKLGFYRQTSAQGGGAAAISNIQFWKTSEYASRPPYCPYGEHYIIPITVGSKTTNIYLDEPLRKIGDYADYIDWKNRKVVRNTSEYILTGNEAWAAYNASNPNLFYSDNAINDNKTGISPLLLKSSHFKIINIASFNSGEMRFQYSGTPALVSAHRLYAKNTACANANIWKEWLQNNNVKVLYVLAEPVEEQISIPDLKSIIPQYGEDYAVTVGTAVTPQLSIKYRSNYPEEV